MLFDFVCIFFIFTLTNDVVVNSLNVLIFGDSLDRMTIEDICTYNNDYIEEDENYLRFLQFKSSYGTLSHYPIFGSNSVGPYFHNEHLLNKTENIIKRTSHRFVAGLDRYYTRYFPPDIVYMHTTAWDYEYIARLDISRIEELNNPSSQYYQSLYKDFSKNMRETVNLLIRLVANVSQSNHAMSIPKVGVRSLPYCNQPHTFDHYHKKCTHFLLSMNAFVHSLAQEYGLVYLDRHADTWNTFHYQHSYDDNNDNNKGYFAEVLRDFIHPNEVISRETALKMLQLQYTQTLLDYSVNVSSRGSSVSSSVSSNVSSSIVSSSYPLFCNIINCSLYSSQEQVEQQGTRKLIHHLQRWIDHQLIIKLFRLIIHKESNNIHHDDFFIVYPSIHSQASFALPAPLCKLKMNFTTWAGSPTYFSASSAFHLSSLDILHVPLVDEEKDNTNDIEKSTKRKFLSTLSALPTCFQHQRAKPILLPPPSTFSQQQERRRSSTTNNESSILILSQHLQQLPIISLPIIFRERLCRGLLVFPDTSAATTPSSASAATAINSSTHLSSMNATLMWIHDHRLTWSLFTGNHRTIERMGYELIKDGKLTVKSKPILMQKLRRCDNKLLYMQTLPSMLLPDLSYSLSYSVDADSSLTSFGYPLHHNLSKMVMMTPWNLTSIMFGMRQQGQERIPRNNNNDESHPPMRKIIKQPQPLHEPFAKSPAELAVAAAEQEKQQEALAAAWEGGGTATTSSRQQKTITSYKDNYLFSTARKRAIIYVMKEGRKCKVKDMIVLVKHGWQVKDVMIVDQTFLDKIPSGIDIVK